MRKQFVVNSRYEIEAITDGINTSLSVYDKQSDLYLNLSTEISRTYDATSTRITRTAKCYEINTNMEYPCLIVSCNFSFYGDGSSKIWGINAETIQVIQSPTEIFEKD